MDIIFLSVFVLLYVPIVWFDYKKVRQEEKNVRRIVWMFIIITISFYGVTIIGWELYMPTQFIIDYVGKTVREFLLLIING